MTRKHKSQEEMRDWISHVEDCLHTRMNEGSGNLEGISYAHFRHYDKHTGIAKGGVTVAYFIEKMEDENIYSISYVASCCSPKDNWNRTEARLRAIRRLYDFTHDSCGRERFPAEDKKEAERTAHEIVVNAMQHGQRNLSWYKGIRWTKEKAETVETKEAE
jgi:hypothetical protein